MRVDAIIKNKHLIRLDRVFFTANRLDWLCIMPLGFLGI